MLSFHQTLKQIRNSIFIAITILLFSCGESKEFESIDISLFIDVTNGNTINESQVDNLIERIFSYSDISLVTGGDNTVDFVIYELNQVSESTSVKFHLEPGVSGLLGQNPLDRIEEIKVFDKQIRVGFSKIINKERKTLEKSKIYQNLCRELNSMDFTADKALILINSDMLENSELFSFYSSAKKPKLTPDGVGKMLEKIEDEDCEFPDLRGIQIVAVSQRTIEDDELINEAEEFWSILFDMKNGQFSMESDYNF